MGPRPPPPPRAADHAPPPKSTSSCSRLRRRWRRRLTVMLGDSSHTPAMLQLAWVCPPAGGGLYPNASIQQYPLIPFRNVFLVTEIARRPRKTTKKYTRRQIATAVSTAQKGVHTDCHPDCARTGRQRQCRTQRSGNRW